MLSNKLSKLLLLFFAIAIRNKDSNKGSAKSRMVKQQYPIRASSAEWKTSRRSECEVCIPVRE